MSPLALGGERLDFSFHQKGTGAADNTILVIGGIQGDEPGGFHAASLLVTHYQLRQGNLWIVPNLNFESIVKRSRGVYGDMNRKFSYVAPTDPDYDYVQRVKAFIRDPQVDYVLNLHDGSGFFRPLYVDAQHNPARWGQSIIIDQDELETAPRGRLGDTARSVTEELNGRLCDVQHRFHVKNTKTREGDLEMEKTLTYFAINENKPAVGLEASKRLPTHVRAYYHLAALEAYMKRLDIEFERGFALTPAEVKRAIDDNVRVSFYDNRMSLDMKDARSRLRYVPLKKNAELEFRASNPLVAITGAGQAFRVNYGNRRVTELHPQFFEYDTSRSAIEMVIDEHSRRIPLGTTVTVRDAFTVSPLPGYRVNVIGWRREDVVSESGVRIAKVDIPKRFSVDRHGTTFRVEVYRGGKFTGMVLVRFAGDTTASEDNETKQVS